MDKKKEIYLREIKNPSNLKDEIDIPYINYIRDSDDEKTPEKAMDLFERAESLKKQGKYERAMEKLDESINLFKKQDVKFYENISNCRHYGNALNLKAVIYQLNGEVTKALMYYHQSFRIDYLNPSFKNKENLLEKINEKTIENDRKNLVNITDEEIEMIYYSSWSIQNLHNTTKKLLIAWQLAKTGNNLTSNSKTENEFKKLIKTVENKIDFAKDYEKTLEEIKNISSTELITITGTKSHEDKIVLRKGIQLRLVKEPDNPYDEDAIAVFHNEHFIGYVANTDHSAADFTSKASNIDVSEKSYVKYLIKFENEYHIAQIIK